MHDPVDSLEAFYAYALAIEREAAGGYREFSRYFASRREPVLSALCDMLARMEADHHAELARAAARGGGNALEHPLAPDATGPASESGRREAFYRMQDPEQLLAVALDRELRARRFFEWASRHSADATVRSLAAQMALEEERHIRWISEAMALHRPLQV